VVQSEFHLKAVGQIFSKASKIPHAQGTEINLWFPAFMLAPSVNKQAVLIPVAGGVFLFCLGLVISIEVQAQRSQQTPAPTPPPAIKASVNEVLVPVVVRDAQEHAVGNLTKDDFQVFDNGKPQGITGFTIIKRATETSAANSSAPSPDATDSPAVSQPTSPPQRFVVFLFDDYNLTFSDLPNAQQAAIKALDSSLAPTDFVAVLSTSGANSGLTRDHAKLKQVILDLKVKTLLRTNEHDCPNVDYYQGDRIINIGDDQAFQAAVIEVVHCVRNIAPEAAEAFARSAAERAVLLGEQNYRANLYSLRLILNKLMGPLPGQHVVILISSGFFTSGPEAVTIKSEILDIAARTNTVINALDARGLYTTNVGAEVTTRVDEASQRLINQYRRESMDANADAMGELADGTGGTFYHNSNDLEAGLRTLISGADYTYLLAFSMANTKPGTHRSLKVKVREPGLTVQARRGYSTPAPEKHKK
jgi:VWFA-related protein